MWRIALPAPSGNEPWPGKLKRRRFLGRALAAGAAVLGAGGAVQLARFLGTAIDRRDGRLLEVAAKRVPQPGEAPRLIREGRFYLVNLRPGEGGFQAQPGSTAGGVLALSARCPHFGCTLPWRAGFVFAGRAGWFRCPCHGSTYTKAGLRVFGPAPHSMDTLPLSRHKNGSLTVRWTERRRGDRDDAARAAATVSPPPACPAGLPLCPHEPR